MNIVVDTNVFVSAVFFGGFPRRVIQAIIYGRLNAYATTEIIDEYEEIVKKMILRKQGVFNKDIMQPFISSINVINMTTYIQVCRDPDDDKFIGCALDAKAIYIVSGDKDLLDIESYQGIEIITAKDFCDKFLNG